MPNKYDINQDKTLFQVIDRLSNNLKVTINCVKIGEVLSFDKEDQTVSVRVLHVIDENYNTSVDGEIEYPVIQKVPVVIMGGGTTYISHPIRSGDQCILLFCDYMIDSWWTSGEAKPSIFPRKHDISDPIAIVGVNPTPKAIKDYSEYLKLQYNEKSSIVIGNTIKLDNAIVEATGEVDVAGVVTAESVQPRDGYSGVVYTGTQVLTFANGILVSIKP